MSSLHCPPGETGLGTKAWSPDGSPAQHCDAKYGQTSKSPGELVKQETSRFHHRVLIKWSGLELRILVPDGKACAEQVENHWTSAMLSTLLPKIVRF